MYLGCERASSRKTKTGPEWVYGFVCLKSAFICMSASAFARHDDVLGCIACLCGDEGEMLHWFFLLLPSSPTKERHLVMRVVSERMRELLFSVKR